MTVTLQTMVMGFGALIASVGLVLLFIRKEQSQNTIKLLGQEFQISTPALVVFLAGLFVFVMPFVAHIKDLDKPMLIFGHLGTGQHNPVLKPDGLTSPSPVHDEQEPNDDIDRANLIELGTRVRGATASYEDRDFFKFKSSGRVPSKVRVILRKLSPDGFWATVEVYDQVERHVARGAELGERTVSFAFEGTPNTLYYILVKPEKGQGLGPYELEVREE